MAAITFALIQDSISSTECRRLSEWLAVRDVLNGGNPNVGITESLHNVTQIKIAELNCGVIVDTSQQ